LDLEAARKIDAERQIIQNEASKRAEERYHLRLAEKEKQIHDAKRANDELKRKLEQGSQQAQGEVLEIQLEELLRGAFLLDQIEAVPKGMNGADIVQKVFTRSGQNCGTIVWESKRTKSWSDGWLLKLKEDQRQLKAEIAVLVSEALPKDCRGFSQVSGIWVSDPQCAVSLATLLRCQLLQVAATRAAAIGAKQKSELLYEYVASTQFRHRVESVAEAFMSMHTGLQEEKRSTHRLWAKRESLRPKFPVVWRSPSHFARQSLAAGFQFPNCESGDRVRNRERLVRQGHPAVSYAGRRRCAVWMTGRRSRSGFRP
jgi:hypothetical protein